MVSMSILISMNAVSMQKGRPLPTPPTNVSASTNAEINALVQASQHPQEEQRIIELQQKKLIPTFEIVQSEPAESQPLSYIWNKFPDTDFLRRYPQIAQINSENNNKIKQLVNKQILMHLYAGPLIFKLTWWNNQEQFSYLDIDALATLYAFAILYNYPKGQEIAEQWNKWRSLVPPYFNTLVREYLSQFAASADSKQMEINSQMDKYNYPYQTLAPITEKAFEIAGGQQYRNPTFIGSNALGNNLSIIFKQMFFMPNPTAEDILLAKNILKVIIDQAFPRGGLGRDAQEYLINSLISTLQKLPGGHFVIAALLQDPDQRFVNNLKEYYLKPTMSATIIKK